MTAAVDVTAEVLDIPESAGSRSAWTQWFTDRIEPGWRPGEWNPQTWFFDGDPANELTAAGLCEVVLLRAEDRRATHVRRVPEDLSSFRDVPRTVRRLSRLGEEAEDLECRGRSVRGDPGRHEVRRTGALHGVVSFPLQQLPLRRADQGPVVAGLVAAGSPVPGRRPECVVIGCGELVAGRQELCQYHRARYLVDCRKRATRLVQKEWARQEVPFLRAGQFSLNTLLPLVRLELLYSVQSRAAGGGVVQPKTMRLVVNHVRERDHLVGVSAAQIACENWRTSNELTVMGQGKSNGG